MNSEFKTCPCCQNVWPNQESFLSDSQLVLNGYQADFEKLEYGLFYFTHQKTDCLSTMALQVKDFLNLYTGPVYSERRTGMEDCPGYCLNKEQLSRCDALCECAFVREISYIIQLKQSA